MSRPSASSCLARASTSKAVSLPNLLKLSANRIRPLPFHGLRHPSSFLRMRCGPVASATSSPTPRHRCANLQPPARAYHSAPARYSGSGATLPAIIYGIAILFKLFAPTRSELSSYGEGSSTVSRLFPASSSSISLADFANCSRASLAATCCSSTLPSAILPVLTSA